MLKREQGQAMTEYIIVVALIGIAAVGVYLFFGWAVREQQTAITQVFAGQDGRAMNLSAQADGLAAVELAKKRKGLDNYMLEQYKH